jgi:hypothetical protein
MRRGRFFLIPQLALCLALSLHSGAASAVLITTPGHYVIDSRVDEVQIDRNISHEVSVEVVSGGVVEGSIGCTTPADDCQATITVSGHGAVLGTVRGADGNVFLRDYARVGSAGAGFGAAVYVSDNVWLDHYVATTLGANHLVMTGGYVGRNLASTEHVTVDISDGTIGSFHNPWGVGLRMSGGQILDGVSGDGYFQIKDGSVWGGMAFADYDLDSWISGGALNANADEYVLRYSAPGTLTISGGLIGNINQGSGLYFGGFGDVIFEGRGLSLTEGVLNGYLLDGSYIDVMTTFGNSWQGTFNIHNVPEPGTLGLLAISLFGLRFAKRRKRQTQN